MTLKQSYWMLAGRAMLTIALVSALIYRTIAYDHDLEQRYQLIQIMLEYQFQMHELDSLAPVAPKK